MRNPSCITKLDKLLHGGFIKGSSVLIAGSCGTGKTNLCMQSLFNAAERGEKCAYISLLSEPRDKIIQTLSTLSFFDETLIGERIDIFSISSHVIAKGDFAIFEYINDNIIRKKPSRVVIDTINILEDIESAFEERQLHSCELRTFVQDLFMEFYDNDILMMATGEIPARDIDSSIWAYMFDTVIVLDTEVKEKEIQRYLEIIKERGSDFVMGRHRFLITQNGIMI